MCVGRQDPLVYQQNRDFVQAMQDGGIQIQYEESEGAHETDFWESKMDAVFSFLAGVPEGSKNELMMG